MKSKESMKKRLKAFEDYMLWQDVDTIKDVPVRVYNCLIKAKRMLEIRSVKDLLGVTQEELLSLKDFGVKSLKDLNEYLNSFGFYVGMFKADRIAKFELKSKARTSKRR